MAKSMPIKSLHCTVAFVLLGRDYHARVELVRVLIAPVMPQQQIAAHAHAHQRALDLGGLVRDQVAQFNRRGHFFIFLGALRTAPPFFFVGKPHALLAPTKYFKQQSTRRGRGARLFVVTRFVTRMESAKKARGSRPPFLSTLFETGKNTRRFPQRICPCAGPVEKTPPK